MFEIQSLPKKLFDKKNATMLNGILRGVEREALRTSPHGQLSQQQHPIGLGSALTHPQITTDFSEALLEFITPPTHQIEDLFSHLTAIQKFVISQLNDEILWPTSMPCSLGNSDQIPVARYGNSSNGLMKTIYRIGLGNRYGRSMQAVSGIHYNFSLPNAFWAFLSREMNSLEDLQEFKDRYYFKLVRNFRRHYWLLIYLFGASPALCKSFVAGRSHHLQTLTDESTLCLPHATSLRMGDLGYQSTVQESLYICYNDMASYITSLCHAITRSHPIYENIGLKNAHGEYLQLNTSVLQIENEFYSAIRPKRTAKPGETALSALKNRGIEYIEVRCMDVNPFDPLGITEEQIHFLDTFLLYCALQDSPPTNPDESASILCNQKKVVNYGRLKNLTLQHNEYGELSLKEWGLSLIENMQPLAELLDLSQNTQTHQASLERQKQKVTDSELTPSAIIINALNNDKIGFADYTLKLAHKHDDILRETPLDEDINNRMLQMAEESLVEQKTIEASANPSFDKFISDYYKQYNCCRE